MQVSFKRFMSLLLVLATLVSCMAVGRFPEKVQAAAAPGSGIHYLDDQHAKAMLGFIYDKSKLTDQYSLLCANVNGNSINIGDVGSLYAHFKGTKTLY